MLGVAAAAADDGQHGGFLLVILLVEKYDQVIGGFQRDARLVAQLGEKGDVALLVLLHAAIGRVAVGEEHTGHSVGSGHLVCDAGKRVGLPCLGFLRLADLCAIRESRRLDGDGVRRAGGINAVQLKLSTIQHLILAAARPVLPDENGADLETGIGSGGSIATPAGLLDIGRTHIGSLAVVADFRPAVLNALDLDFRAAHECAVLAVARAGAGAHIQAAFGCDLVGCGRPRRLRLRGRGQAPGGCRCVDGVSEPLFEPDIIPVLELQLQVVCFVRLLVGIGGREKIGANAGGDVCALKENLCRNAARLVRIAHPTTCFQGGMASSTRSTGSGSFKTMPAGKV